MGGLARLLRTPRPALRLLAVLLAALAAGLLPPPAHAQEAEPSPAPTVRPAGPAPILLILDASGSMRSDDGTGRSKLDAAKEALYRLIDELPEGTPVGLRVYGHRVPNSDRAQGCTDTELIRPVVPLDRQSLRDAVGSFQATGFTPIGASLEAALGDLPPGVPSTVILVSDGIDTCSPPDPCTVAGRLASQAVDLRVETVGFQVDAAATAQLTCIADVTGGSFRAVQDAGSLLRALRQYQVSGSPVTGADDAEDAPVLASGQYRDTIEVGQARWYAVDLAEGQVLRTTATVVGGRGTPVAPDATLELEVVTGDVLGLVTCGEDEVQRLGQEARQVGVDGLDTSEIGLCTEPGRYAIRLELPDDDPEQSPLAGVPLDVELLVSIVGGEEAEAAIAAGEASAPPTELDTLPAEPPASSGGNPVLAGLLSAFAGGLVGMLVARRLGP